MYKPHYRPHGIGDVGSRLVSKLHQTPHQFAKWAHLVSRILVKLPKESISRTWGAPACGHVNLIDRL